MGTFQVGDRVRVISPFEYKGKFLHKSGEVTRTFKNSDKGEIYGVSIDNNRNPNSLYGVYWFGRRHLEFETVKIESEENIMFENYKVAEVCFMDKPNTVCSFALYDPDIKERDIVVVSTINHGFALAEVSKIYDKDDEHTVRSGREVVCKVDFTNFLYRKDKVKRMQELKASMEAKLQEVQALAIFEMFAEKDPSLKSMLDEFKEVSNLIKGE